MRKTYRYSHSIGQGGFMFVQKSDKPIDKEPLWKALQPAIEKCKLIDVTLKVHENVFFLFFAAPRGHSPQQVADEIRSAIAWLAWWDEEYLMVTVDDVQEESVKKELARLGITDDAKPSEKPAPKNIAPIILSAIKQLHAGRAKATLFLAGSKAAEVLPLQNLPGYGGLLWYNSKTIEGFLAQLEKQGYITTHMVKTPDYSYPILILTEEGERALEQQREIPLLNIKLAPKISESEEQTFVLFKQGKNPKQIAEIRELQESTIYDHFINLIGAGRMSATQVISSHVIKKILQARNKFVREPRLKELKEMLPDISYTEIRCVLADRPLATK
jgi:DNA-binding PadR family transcriptional regulator